jgi:hypothetical protein
MPTNEHTHRHHDDNRENHGDSGSDNSGENHRDRRHENRDNGRNGMPRRQDRDRRSTSDRFDRPAESGAPIDRPNRGRRSTSINDARSGGRDRGRANPVQRQTPAPRPAPRDPAVGQPNQDWGRANPGPAWSDGAWADAPDSDWWDPFLGGDPRLAGNARHIAPDVAAHTSRSRRDIVVGAAELAYTWLLRLLAGCLLLALLSLTTLGTLTLISHVELTTVTGPQNIMPATSMLPASAQRSAEVPVSGRPVALAAFTTANSRAATVAGPGVGSDVRARAAAPMRSPLGLTQRTGCPVDPSGDEPGSTVAAGPIRAQLGGIDIATGGGCADRFAECGPCGEHVSDSDGHSKKDHSKDQGRYCTCQYGGGWDTWGGPGVNRGSYPYQPGGYQPGAAPGWAWSPAGNPPNGYSNTYGNNSGSNYGGGYPGGYYQPGTYPGGYPSGSGQCRTVAPGQLRGLPSGGVICAQVGPAYPGGGW